MKIIDSVSEITNNYDYYIIDLWGVLHDGETPYPNSIEALKYIKNNAKKVVLLSNAPRRANKAKEVLDELGFTEDLYDKIITSGEVTYDFVKSSRKNNTLGKKYFYIGPEKDRDVLSGLDITEVDNAKDADFALATGFEGWGSVFEEKQQQLDDSLKAGLELLVANPDKKVVKQTGEVYICSGLMADYYTEKGGEVTYFGKPYPKAYEYCMDFFGTKNVNKILCIGDSFYTDIKGGNSLGASTLLCTCGIFRADIMVGNNIIEENLKKTIEAEQETPTYVIKEFC